MSLKLPIVAGLSLLVAAITLGGCDEEEPSVLSLLSGGCLLNSDCDEGLVCVFERCHIECNDSSDCPLDDEGVRLRCVVGERAEHVCQLPDEATCSYHSECPGQQICGPDGRCRDQCQDDRDCVGAQICVPEGACADDDEIGDDGQLDATEAPPEQQTGFPCAYNSQCLGLAPEAPAIEYVCRAGGCNYECYADVDCQHGFECVVPGAMGTPGNCVILDVGVGCPPGNQVACDCYPDGDRGFQTCADGVSYGDCIRLSDGLPCPIE